MEIIRIISFVVLTHGVLGLELNHIEISSKDNARIVGGKVIPLSEAPYQVSMQIRSRPFCGGSIISSTYILTAGHCIYLKNSDLLAVRLGSDRSSTGGEVISVKQTIMHPEYNQRTVNNDFALVQLAREISLEKGVREIIQLPSLNDPIQDGSKALVTGWGDTKNVFESNYLLRGAEVSIITQSTCKRAYSFLTQQMVCAGNTGGGVDACQGDSGGPLKRISDGLLIGVVSFGYGCALPRYPGVYARVERVRDWIKIVAEV